MSATIIMSTIERKVMDAMEDLKGSNFAVMIKFIAIGIMVFMVCLGGVILLRSIPAGGTAPTNAPTILGFMLLMWRQKRCHSR